MKNVVTNIKNRISSDRADSLTVSQILWITFAVVLVIAVGGMVYQAIARKGTQVADCINNSHLIFKNDASGTSNCGAS